MKLLDRCQLCGGSEFSYGRVYSHGITFFVANGRGIGDMFMGDKKSNLVARVCIGCKNVLFFAPDIDADDRNDPATITW